MQQVHIDLTGAMPADLLEVHQGNVEVHVRSTASGRTSVLISFVGGAGRWAIELTASNLLSLAGAVRGLMTRRGEINLAINPGVAMSADPARGVVHFSAEGPLQQWDYTAPHALHWAKMLGEFARAAGGVAEPRPSDRDVAEIERLLSDPRETHFTAQLFRLIKKSDYEHRMALWQVYPHHVDAVRLWEIAPYTGGMGVPVERIIDRILVTGDDQQLAEFELQAPAANAINRRGQTAFFTTTRNHLVAICDLARHLDLTLQLRQSAPEGSPPESFWPVMVQGTMAPWTSAADENKGGAS